MDGRRAGHLIRAVRHELRWRQADLAAAAGVSQKQVSRVELGRLDELTFQALDKVAAAVQVKLTLVATWRGGAGDRLIDQVHASLVADVAAILSSAGWQIIPEYTFNHFGDRGSVDILPWHATSRTLLIVEVKSRIHDLQDLLARLATKVRVVPAIVARERGWRPTHVARLIVVPGITANRSIVARHRAVFDAAYPARAPEIRRWIQAPISALAGVWFLSGSRGTTRKRGLRVRRRGPAAAPLTAAASGPAAES
jgi:transcriptional regulator with XRE-family HTH domain